MTTISAVLMVRDEEAVLPGCLRRLDFVDEVVVVVDDRTTDATAAVAEAAGAVVVHRTLDDFASQRNAGIAVARSEWILVVDADERVGSDLAHEIVEACRHRAAYRVPLLLVLQGRAMTAGDWDTEAPVRLCPRDLARYRGTVHEQLDLPAGTEVRSLQSRMTHFTHRSVLENVRKVERYAPAQADERLAADPRPASARTVARAFARELVRRLIRHRGYRDGVPGWAEALHTAYALAVVEVLVWERQQSPSIDEVYARLDEEIR